MLTAWNQFCVYMGHHLPIYFGGVIALAVVFLRRKR